MKIICLFILLTFSHIVFGQRNAVVRRSVSDIPCFELNCDDSDSTYENLDRFCLTCLLRSADSTMGVVKNKILEKCPNSRKGCKAFVKNQQQWELTREKAARKEGDKYKGGTMEITEYIRTKLILTNRRLSFLDKHLEKLSQ